MSKLSIKFISGAVSIATIMTLSGSLMPVAGAQSVADLQAQINLLLAQITALQAQLGTAQSGTPTTSYNYTRDLTVGSKGDDVSALQQFLIGKGFLTAVSAPTGYFGSLTKAALGAYQASVGISPTAGYFGPKTRAYIASLGVIPPSGDMCLNIEGIQTAVLAGYTRDTFGNCVAATVGTGLTAALAFDTPQSTTVLKGASNVPFLKFTISGSGTVNTIAATRVGPGQAADFASSGVYLMDENGGRLVTGRTVNTATQKVNFTGLNLAVNGTRTLTIVGILSTVASSSDKNAFEISSAADITGTATVGGVYPIRGNEMTVGGATIATATIATSTLPANPKVGEIGAKLATFKITNNASTDDLKVVRVTLRYSGAVSKANLSNFVVKYAGTQVGTGLAINAKDLLILTFSPAFQIDRGQNRIFDVYGDVSAAARSGSSETIKFYIEDSNDVVANSVTYGGGATVTNNWTNTDGMTLDGGQITITFNGPTANSGMPTSGSDVTFFDFTVASAVNAEVKNLRFAITTTGMAGATNEKLSDFKVVDAATGAVVSGPFGTDITTTTAALVLSDTWNLSAGQSRRLRVTADIGSASGLANDTVRVDLSAFTGTDIKNIDANLDVATSDIVPNGVTGNTHTIKAPSLTITLAGTPASRTLSAGAANVDLVGIKFQSVADDIQIKSITISASGADIGTAGFISSLGSLRLMADGTQIGQSKSLSGSAFPVTAAFTGLNYTITKDNSKTIMVNAPQLASNASSTTYVVGVNDLSTDVTAVDSQGNTLTLSGSVNPTTGTTVQLTLGTPTLTVTRVGAGSDDTDTGFIVSGGTKVLTRLEFRATNGDVTVNKLQLGVIGAADGATVAATVATSTGISDDVTTVSLKMCTNAGCTSKTVVTGLDMLSPDANGNAAGTVTANNASGFFTIPRGETRYFTVEGTAGNIQVGAADYADAGTSIYASVLGGYTNTGGSGNFEAVSGNTTLTSFATSTGGTNLGVQGTQKILMRSVPIVTVSKPDGVLSSALSPAIDVTFNADTNPVAIKAFGINVSVSNASVTAPTGGTGTANGNVDITNITTNSTVLIASVSGAALDNTSGDFYISLLNPLIVYPGSPQKLRVKVTAANVVNGTISSRLTTSLDRNETSQTVNATAGGLIGVLMNWGGTNVGTSTAAAKQWAWSDLSDDQTGSVTATEWANAVLIRPFPSDTVSVTP